MITQMRNRIELANLVAQLVEVVPLIHAATPHAYAIHVGCGFALQQSFEALIEHSPIETIPAAHKNIGFEDLGNLLRVVQGVRQYGGIQLAPLAKTGVPGSEQPSVSANWSHGATLS